MTIKGFGSGTGSLITALIIGEHIPNMKYIMLALLLGFVAYGLSIFTYIRAQKTLGAAKTSAYYAVAPFIGAFLSFTLLHEELTPAYFVALLLMAVGTFLVAADTLVHHHIHGHTHTFTHTHDGRTHTHTIVHSHDHEHILTDDNHNHTHTLAEFEHCLQAH